MKSIEQVKRETNELLLRQQKEEEERIKSLEKKREEYRKFWEEVERIKPEIGKTVDVYCKTLKKYDMSGDTFNEFLKRIGANTPEERRAVEQFFVCKESGWSYKYKEKQPVLEPTKEPTNYGDYFRLLVYIVFVYLLFKYFNWWPF